MSSGPFYPVFAYAKDKTATAAGSVAADQDTFDLGGGHGFLVGETPFISTSGDAENQYLGPITDVDGVNVTTTWSTNTAKGTSSKLWTAPAGQIVRMTHGPSGGFTPERDSRIFFDETAGDADTATKTGVTVSRLVMGFGPALTSDFLAWETFLDEKRLEGAQVFSAAYWDRKTNSSVVNKVRYITPISTANFGRGLKFTSFEALFKIKSEDEYVLV